MRVMVLGAGGNAGNNAARCFWAHGHDTLGADPDQLMLGLSDCDQTVPLTTRPSQPQAHLREIKGLLARYGIGFVWAQPEQEVLFLAENRRHLGVATCVPQPETVRVTQDKLKTAKTLGPLAPLSGGWGHINDLFQVCGNELWMRQRKGAGSTGALKIGSLAQAEFWAGRWPNTTASDWMFAEVLPGRDLSWTGVYDRGELVICVEKERLKLLGAQRSPANVASTATAQRIVHHQPLRDVCTEAIRVLDDRPHGVYMVDAREDELGNPRVTEVNAGRFGTTMDMFAECGPCLVQVALEVGTGTYTDPYGRTGEHTEGAVWLRNTDSIGRLV